MFVQLLRILGVTPDGSKTGKREAAWMLIFITCVFTGVAVYQGADITGVLTILWPAAIAAVFGAYKLEYDHRQRQTPPDTNTPPQDWQSNQQDGA